MLEFSQISRVGNLSDTVAAMIKESIIRGDYQTGDALPNENLLASQFGVSRIVIREALKDLKTRGLVEIRRGPKGGPFVARLEKLPLGEHFGDLIRLRRMTIDQFYQVRMLIEPEVVRLVVVNITGPQLKELQKLVDASKNSKNTTVVKDQNLDFHRRLGQLSGNPFYEMLMNSFMDFMDGFITCIKPQDLNLHADDQSHQEIVEAIAAREETKACALVNSHLLKTWEALKRLEGQYLAHGGNGSW